jgi:Uma2 family endonuclease
MMAQPNLAPLPHYSFEEYLALERYSDIKHEYLDGVIVAMTGASKVHDIVATNLRRLLANHLQVSPCRVAGSDLKLHIEAAGRCFYPDLMVVCSDPRSGDLYRETDARLVIEVLSESTAEYDRTVKAEAYRLLPSLQEYLLVALDWAEVHCCRRTGEGWVKERYGPGDDVPVLGGELPIPLAAIYERLGLAL